MGSSQRLKKSGVVLWSVTLLVFLVACVANTKHDSQTRTYTIRKGDTLYSIAWRYHLDYKKLAWWNGIGAPYTIYPGQQLRLNPPKAIPLKTTPPSKEKKITRSKVDQAKVDSQHQNRSSVKHDSKLYWHWPTNGQVIEGFSASGTVRKGIDIAGVPGQSVKAASRGKVVYSGSGLIGYGQLIIIKHDETFLSAYAHNRKLLVKEGDYVTIGQRIAELGNTGTDRPKLHFEIRRYGQPVDPLKYLPRR